MVISHFASGTGCLGFICVRVYVYRPPGLEASPWVN
jgi:hypothetical protein